MTVSIPQSGDIHRAEDIPMTPANAFTIPSFLPEQDNADLISDLTLDELRELPVRTQLGLDLTACEDWD